MPMVGGCQPGRIAAVRVDSSHWPHDVADQTLSTLVSLQRRPVARFRCGPREGVG
jgi:hypothetical protein